MLGVLQVLIWCITGVGVILLLAAAVGRFPRRAAFALAAVGELAALAAVVVDIVWVRGGQSSPDLLTHISYLVFTPLILPAGVALTYKKIDRWGLLIIAVAALITTTMIVRQIQTLGIEFGRIGA